MSKRLLISGISGFTGQYLKHEFLEQGWEVFGFDSHPVDDDPYYRCVNLLDITVLRRCVKEIQPTAVAHLAGIAFAANRSAMDYYNTHVLGTLNLLSALTDNASGLKKVLLASTSNVYGNTTSEKFLESAPLKPFNDYGVSKLAMEYMAWLRQNMLPMVIVRPFNYTGVGQAKHFLLPKIVWHFKKKAKEIELGNTFVERDFSDVRYVVKAYRRLIECDAAVGAVNVCSGMTHSLRHIIKICEQLSEHSIIVRENPELVRANEVKSQCGDATKLRSLIGEWNMPPLQETLRWMVNS